MTVDITELMRRVKAKERAHSESVHAALAPYPKRRKPRVTLGKDFPTRWPSSRQIAEWER